MTLRRTHRCLFDPGGGRLYLLSSRNVHENFPKISRKYSIAVISEIVGFREVSDIASARALILSFQEAFDAAFQVFALFSILLCSV